MEIKKKKCVECGEEKYIFSKGRCKFCASKTYKSLSSSSTKRKEKSSCLGKFFLQHIQNIKQNNLRCAECGEKLRGMHSEVAHILPKSQYPSIQCESLNVIYLCGHLSENQCHNNFDNFSAEKVASMKIYPYICSIFNDLVQKATEVISLKDRTKYGQYKRHPKES